MVLGMVTAVLTACQTNEPRPEASLAEVVTVSVERPSATATPAASSTLTATRQLVETAVPTSTPTPTATYLPSPTPLPPLVWSEGLNYAAHVDSFSGSTVTWSPTRSEFIATTCWNFELEPKFFRFIEPAFEQIDITPPGLSCEPLDDTAWTSDGEKILYSDTFPEDHPNHPGNYGYDNSAIWIVNRDGSEYQPLNFDEAYGRYLVFSDWLDSETLVYKYYCGGGYDCVVTLDGRFLAYQTLLPAPQFHIMDFETRQVIHTFPNAEPILELRIAATKAPYLWSPDSTKLVFRDSQGNLTVLTVADGSLTPLSVAGGERLHNPNWSFDGRYLSVSVQNGTGDETAVLTFP